MPQEILDSIAQALQARQNPMVIRSAPLTGGLNNRYAPQYLTENQAAELLNVDLDDVTRPSMRDGYTVMPSMTNWIDGTTDGTTSTLSGIDHTNDRIAGIAQLHKSDATKMLFIAVDHTLTGECFYRSDVGSGGSWALAKVDGTDASFSPATQEAVIFQANDALVVVGGAATEVHTFTSAGTMYEGGDANTSPPKGAVDGCYMLNRIWLFKQGTASTPPELHYSKLLPDMTDPGTQFGRNGTDVSSTLAGRLQLSPNRGGTAIAVEPWNETSLMCFFDDSIEEILVVNDNPQADSIRRVIEPNIGCGSRYSVVSVGQEMYFIDQYGQVRSLQQTVTAAQAGVVPKPLSEPIANEIPGQMNTNALSRVRSWVYRDKLYVAYPRIGSTEANAIAVYSLANRIWESIWRPKHAIGGMVISDIRSQGEDVWTANGGAGGSTDPYPQIAKVYRWFDNSYKDDGNAITYRETSKGFFAGAPESDKVGRWVELEARGSPQAEASVAIAVDEDEKYVKLTDNLVVTVTGSSFPVVDAGQPDEGGSTFPVGDPGQATTSNFPLLDPEPGIARKIWSTYELTDCGRGRIYQVRIEANKLGKRFLRSGYRLGLDTQPHEGPQPLE